MQKAIEPSIARHAARDRSRRAPLRHQVPHECLEVLPSQLIDTLPSAGGELRQPVQIARVALDRVRRETTLDGEVREIRVQCGHTVRHE